MSNDVISPELLTIKIRDEDFLQYSGFTITRTLKNFIDTFNITCSNPGGKYSRKFMAGDKFQMFIYGVEFFRGYIDIKNVSWSNIGSNLTLSGREEIAEICEDDINPALGPFKDTTDNEIITNILSGTDYTLDLGEAKTIKEYEINSGSTKKGQVLEDVVRFKKFLIWKKGKTIYKRPIPSTGIVKTRYVFWSGKESIIKKTTSRIMDMQLNEDIQGVRSNIKGYSYTRDKTKTTLLSEKENTTVLLGDYVKSLRNLSTQSGRKIIRTQYVAVSSKDQKENDELTQQALDESNIKLGITLILSGYENVDLGDIVYLDAEAEDISQNFYIKQIVYKFDNNNRRTTEIELNPLNLYPY